MSIQHNITHCIPACDTAVAKTMALTVDIRCCTIRAHLPIRITHYKLQICAQYLVGY